MSHKAIIPERVQAVPAGLTQSQIRQMLPTEEWREVTTHIHRSCGTQAVANPYTDKVWGCPKCMVAAAPDSGFFDSIE